MDTPVLAALTLAITGLMLWAAFDDEVPPEGGDPSNRGRLSRVDPAIRPGARGRRDRPEYSRGGSPSN